MNNDAIEQRLPVMVYIHGGFLSFGSSSGQLSWMKARPSGRLATGKIAATLSPS